MNPCNGKQTPPPSGFLYLSDYPFEKQGMRCFFLTNTLVLISTSLTLLLLFRIWKGAFLFTFLRSLRFECWWLCKLAISILTSIPSSESAKEPTKLATATPREQWALSITYRFVFLSKYTGVGLLAERSTDCTKCSLWSWGLPKQEKPICRSYVPTESRFLPLIRKPNRYARSESLIDTAMEAIALDMGLEEQLRHKRQTLQGLSACQFKNFLVLSSFKTCS